MFDGKGTIMNENRYWDEVYQRWSIAVLPTRDGNASTDLPHVGNMDSMLLHQMQAHK